MAATKVRATLNLTIHCEIHAEVMSELSDEYYPGQKTVDPLDNALSKDEVEALVKVLAPILA